MYLKNLAIHGFKSFANRTSLEFPSSLIGIVGPNGSGKSNICDSIRWVLGEQSSKALRGQKMDDVIFGGTSTVPPAKFAEVRLTFDNKSRFFKIDSDDFVLTRKINRNGDADYIINGEPCRLKDIKEQIMDTGLGRDAYSIIGQGMVDSIIGPRGAERRAIIEEAAGIVKYKADKNECLRKIALAQADIDRLSDLIGELDAQLGPRSLEAQKAQRYMVLDEQLRTLKLKKMVFEFDRQYRELALKKATAAEYQKKRDEHASKIRVFEAEIEAMQAKVVTLNDRRAQIKKDNLDVITELESLQEVEKNLLTKIAEINANRESYVRSADEYNEKREALETAIKETEAEIISSEEYLKGLELEIKKLQEDISGIAARIKSSSAELNSSESTTYDAINELAAAKNDLIQHEGELKYTQQEIGKLKFDMDRLEEKIKGLEAKSSRGSDSQQSDRRRHGEIGQRLLEIAEKLKGLCDEEKRLEKTIQDDSAELIGVRAKLAAQEEVRRNMDGFNRGVRFVMGLRQQKPDQFKGICGLVSELLRVPPEYETAIEVALGGNIQGVVVEKARDAEPLIDMLKREKIGRVSFYPLDAIRPGPPAVIPSALKGFIGIATDLIECNAKHRGVYEYLLNPVMVVDTLQHVNDFIARNKFSGRIVTLEGEIVVAGGVITGGHIEKKSGSSHFANSGALDSLRSRSVYLDDKIGQNDKKLVEIRGQIAKLRDETDTLKLEKTRLETILEKSGESSEDYARDLANAREEMQALREGLDAKKKEEARLEPLVVKDRGVVAALEEKSRAFHESVKKRKSSHDRESEEFNMLNGTLTEKKVEHARINENLNNYRKKVIDDKKAIEAIDKRTRLDRDALLKYEEQFRSEDALLKDAQAKLAEIKSRTSSIQAKDEEIANELNSLDTQIRIKTGLIGSRDRQAREMTEKIHELEVQQAEVETNIKNSLNLLETEFRIREDEFPAYRDPEFKYDDAADEIASLQRSIDLLGLVNQSAIRDYQELLERVNKLKSERDDLVAGRDDIYKIVQRTDAECTRMFMDTFNRINQHIGEIFQLLFNGGQAKLVLEDETKPLECNIDIKAQPPGKRLQSITLMSGGEKALTGLSLLFSILRVKPSPFCILDEVEAALDEFNVLRFVNMLNNFKDKTQFLIITHNKQTMQHLDLLYGVTMEEKGISKIISVRLEQAYDIVDMGEAKAKAAQSGA